LQDFQKHGTSFRLIPSPFEKSVGAVAEIFRMGLVDLQSSKEVNTRVVQKVLPHIFFLRVYLFKMVEIW
jgi:hypothetical protein